MNKYISGHVIVTCNFTCNVCLLIEQPWCYKESKGPICSSNQWTEPDWSLFLSTARWHSSNDLPLTFATFSSLKNQSSEAERTLQHQSVLVENDLIDTFSLRLCKMQWCMTPNRFLSQILIAIRTRTMSFCQQEHLQNMISIEIPLEILAFADEPETSEWIESVVSF